MSMATARTSRNGVSSTQVVLSSTCSSSLATGSWRRHTWPDCDDWPLADADPVLDENVYSNYQLAEGPPIGTGSCPNEFGDGLDPSIVVEGLHNVARELDIPSGS